MSRMKIGVLISGRGSNLEALIKATQAADYPAEIVLVISNRPGAKGLEHAHAGGIASQVIDHTAYADRATFEQALDKALRAKGVELVCLAGFMRILNADFVNAWRNRLINVHPSLLPAYKGLHTHQRVIEDGARLTGCTVHFVRPETDDGPIIIQAAVPVLTDDTEETLAARVLAYEHKVYPEAVRLIAEGATRVRGHRVQIPAATWAVEGLINPEIPGDVD
ncbi:MAG: phosphoribosylglycinamide formyltransferase [Proteobacteria bacterium]|nr:phosphoribosylglycinamide formyltransferase [Pseudomonadota bacterium]